MRWEVQHVRGAVAKFEQGEAGRVSHQSFQHQAAGALDLAAACRADLAFLQQEPVQASAREEVRVQELINL